MSESTLSRDEATTILRAFDDNFVNLVALDAWEVLSPRVSSRTKTYTAVYTTTSTSPSQEPPTRERESKILITLGTVHALDAISSLHELISKNTTPGSIPIPSLLKRDDSKSLIPSSYTLHVHPAGVPFNSLYGPPSSVSSSTGTSLSEEGKNKTRTRTKLLSELHLGATLNSLHTHVQNDWFGLPGFSPEEQKEWEECYSWQESFTLLLENALSLIEGHGEGEGKESEHEGDMIPLPTKDIHRLLSRAIASYLFDDVEVPSLILNPSFNWSSHIFLSPSLSPSSSSSPSPSEEEGEGNITGLLAWEENALWGDPLLEGVFHPSPPSSQSQSQSQSFTQPQSELESKPGLESESESESEPSWPSKALLEGYTSNPIVLPRHRTKRLWYDLYVSLLRLYRILDGRKGEGDGDAGEKQKQKEAEKEERKRIEEIVKKLEDARCY